MWHSHKSILLCAVYESLCALWEKACLCSSSPSHAKAIYHILKDGVVFKNFGADYYNPFNKERKIHAYLKKLKALGWEAPIATA